VCHEGHGDRLSPFHSQRHQWDFKEVLFVGKMHASYKPNCSLFIQQVILGAIWLGQKALQTIKQEEDWKNHCVFHAFFPTLVALYILIKDVLENNKSIEQHET